jgi:hypothetical protein
MIQENKILIDMYIHIHSTLLVVLSKDHFRIDSFYDLNM